MQKLISQKTGANINAKAHRKENAFYAEYAVLHKGRARIVLRLYATNAMHYACFWDWSNDTAVSGSGKAGGYGYHRASAAAQLAMNAAGYEFKEAFDGRGDRAIENALMAIARAHKLRGAFIHHAHA